MAAPGAVLAGIASANAILPVAARIVALFGGGKRKEAALIQAEILQRHLEGLSAWTVRLRKEIPTENKMATLLLDIVEQGVEDGAEAADQIGDVLRGKDDDQSKS